MLYEQMERVQMLSKMVDELLHQKLNYIRYSLGSEPSDTEIKRMMLVLRRETLKLDKML